MVIEQKTVNVNSIEKKPVSLKLSKKEQSDSDCDNDSDNSDNTDLQELFNSLNNN